jgi:phage shock protein PspC (stress-responsive transcriptional regulator)
MTADLPNPERPEGAAPPPPPPPPGAEPRRLRRSRDDRVIAGVCGGVGRYLDVDPVVVRIVAVVLVAFGGAGALLYLAGWLLMPDEAGGPAAVSGAPGERRNRGLVVLGAIVLVIAVGPLLFIPALAIGGVIVPLAVLALVGLAVAWLITGHKPDRDAAGLTRAALLGIGMLIVLVLLAVGAFWGAAAGGDGVIAGIVIAAGVALVAGAFAKPVRWLVLPALALAIPAGFVAAADISLDGGIGDKTYRPGTAAEIRPKYELGAGELVVDLRGVDLPAGDRRIAVDVGMGHAQVIVDRDVCVATTAEVGMGAVGIFGSESGGVDVDVDELPRARPGNARVVVDADLGLGFVEVTHRENSNGPRWQDDVSDGIGNAGCVSDAA